ncbi:hypothetical protein [Nocardioides sp. SYSU DS0663]|uniref:hypothetical protein n=1 Tax=Nocardioides sp. SYSU DS0663 TaxID=3416445 RepID=UPI003F4BA56B
MTTTAKIAAKGCTNTGLTEDLAKRLHDQLGKTIVAVVELTAETRTENKAGDETVVLSINTIEVAPNSLTEDHLRDLARAFHYERKLAEDGPQLLEPGDGPEPRVADVLQFGRSVITTDDGETRLLTDDDLNDPELDLDDQHDEDVTGGEIDPTTPRSSGVSSPFDPAPAS